MVAPLTDTDRAHLRRALELAEFGRGRVSPNPLVGAVIVRDGRVIGEGFHAALGEAHAERAAIDDCRDRGEDPEGSTIYVTLEPCAHQGRTPPCANLIVNSGVKRVVIASDDPTAKAAGRGPGILRDGGAEVVFADGEVATAARLLNQPFRKHARTGLPQVILKLALSLDGQSATVPGDSPWISGKGSRELVHRWRAEVDAVAIGVGTAIADDPLLTAREVTVARQPARVVFDSRARLPLESQLVKGARHTQVIVVAAQDAPSDRLAALREAGVETLICSGTSAEERIASALGELGRRHITSLFLEGGLTLAAAFQRAEEIDEARVFVAPVLLGSGARADAASGRDGGELNFEPPQRAAALASNVETIGDDVLVRARFKEW